MSTTASTKSTSKTTKKSKIIIIRLPKDRLQQFPSDVPLQQSPPDASPKPSAQPSEPADKTSEPATTPIPLADTNSHGVDRTSVAPPKPDNKRKRGGTAPSGRKRAPPTIDADHPPRERGRPGPKKKPRMADGTIDPAGAKGTANGTNPAPTHRLGPKANTGNINANLRALDRTGKPCRKWERKGLQLKSFTGAIWSMPSWKAPQRDAAFTGDVKSDTTGSSELKPNDSSALASERSISGVDAGEVTLPNGIESSPAPPIAA